MKTQIFSLIAALLIAGSSTLKAQDWPQEYLGLPGDNLNLYAVMNLFQNSETLEGFERELNNYDNTINNLDLNNDGYVDYIMVFNYVEGDVHHIVLRVALNENEYQDVAVFVVEKLRTGAVQVQLFGDEALYGPDYIIEPAYAETPNPGYSPTVTSTKVTTKQKAKTRRNVTVVHTTFYEVATWPVITYIYRPTYVVWRSPWRWGYYPVYWHSWTPHYWHFYYGYHYNWYSHYYAYYRPWSQPRCINCRTVYYTSIRTYSPVVVVNVNQGIYKHTYSRPETRKEGEVLYAHRRSTGSNLPDGRTAVSTSETRQGSRPATDVNPRTNRSASEGRTSTVGRDTQTRSGSREVTEGTRNRTETVSPGRSGNTREVQRQTQSRSETSSPSRTVTRSTREQAAPAREQNVRNESQNSRATESRSNVNTSRESATAPATRNVERSAPERSRTESRSTPSVSRQESSRSSSVQRSQPSRSENRSSANVKSSERNTSSRSSANVRSTERNTNTRSSGTVERQNNQTERNTESRDSGSSRGRGR